MTIKWTCLALTLAAFVVAGLVTAPAAEAKPTTCSCDLCFAVPYYAICTIPWNGEVVGCLEFLIDYCPVGGPSPGPTSAPVEVAQPEEPSAAAAMTPNRCEVLEEPGIGPAPADAVR
jgi:hypothetical protein